MVDFKSITPADFAKLSPEQQAAVLANVDTKKAAELKAGAAKLQAGLNGSQSAKDIPKVNSNTSIFTNNSPQAPSQQDLGQSILLGVKDGVENVAGMAISAVSFGFVNGREVVDAAEELVKGESVQSRNYGLGGAIYNRVNRYTTNEAVGEELANVAMGAIPGGGTISKGVGALEKAAAPLVEKALGGIVKDTAEGIAGASAKNLAETATASTAKALTKAAETATGTAAKSVTEAAAKDAAQTAAKVTAKGTAPKLAESAVKNATGEAVGVAAKTSAEAISPELVTILKGSESFKALPAEGRKKVLTLILSKEKDISKLNPAQIAAGVTENDAKAAAVETLSKLYKGASATGVAKVDAKAVDTLIRDASIKIADQRAIERAIKETAERKAKADAAAAAKAKADEIAREAARGRTSSFGGKTVNPKAQTSSTGPTGSGLAAKTSGSAAPRINKINEMDLAIARAKKANGERLTPYQEEIFDQARTQELLERETQLRKYRPR